MRRTYGAAITITLLAFSSMFGSRGSFRTAAVVAIHDICP